MTPINSTTHQIDMEMPPIAPHTLAPDTLNNLQTPPNAAGREMQPTTAPTPGEIRENNQHKKRANICIGPKCQRGRSPDTKHESNRQMVDDKQHN